MALTTGKLLRATGGASAETVSNAAIIYEASVTLTNNQIKALPTTGIELIPAGGSGYAIEYLMGYVEVDLTSAYTNLAAVSFLGVRGISGFTALSMVIQDIDADGINDLTTLLTDTSETISRSLPFYTLVDLYGSTFNQVSSAHSLNDESAVVKIDNGAGGNLTGGNAANSMTVKCLYRYIAVGTPEYTP